ncbi:MAG: DUF4234 domain-containing protein [Clostridiales bacterium]|nr:DUF4234 domain-containing protein [Clostridiales bacterium]
MVTENRALWKYIVFSLLTCGIYSYYFIYKMAMDVNMMCSDDGEKTSGLVAFVLLSFLTCGIYAWIWYYKLGNRLQMNAPRYGLLFPENGTSVLLWFIFGSMLCGIGPFIAMNILIRNTNRMAAAYNRQNGGQMPGGMQGQNSQQNGGWQNQNAPQQNNGWQNQSVPQQDNGWQNQNIPQQDNGWQNQNVQQQNNGWQDQSIPQQDNGWQNQNIQQQNNGWQDQNIPQDNGWQNQNVSQQNNDQWQNTAPQGAWQAYCEDQTTVLNAQMLNQTEPQANGFLYSAKNQQTISVTGNEFTIGKAGANVTYGIEGNTSVSRFHAKITRQNNSFYITDQDSTNGTYVNDMRIGHEVVELHDGDRVQFADDAYVFYIR